MDTIQIFIIVVLSVIILANLAILTLSYFKNTVKSVMKVIYSIHMETAFKLEPVLLDSTLTPTNSKQRHNSKHLPAKIVLATVQAVFIQNYYPLCSVLSAILDIN